MTAQKLSGKIGRSEEGKKTLPVCFIARRTPPLSFLPIFPESS
jgi:hypothetical protein